MLIVVYMVCKSNVSVHHLHLHVQILHLHLHEAIVNISKYTYTPQKI